MRRGILSVRSAAEVQAVPLADGGEGTADVLRRALGGDWVSARVTGPRDEIRVDGGYVRLQDGRVVIEMARASGLSLLPEQDRDPLVTTTRGTGELLRAALAEGPGAIWLAAGGSATVDGGTGAAGALGWRFLDGRGEDLPPGGGGLSRLRRIVPPAGGLPPSPVTVLADVSNPLVGPEGAARVFGPQKGADDSAVQRLEEGLQVLAERICEDLGLAVAELPGGGAAGGLGAGAVAFLGAEVVPGVDRVTDATGLPERLDGADWVVTGEGRLDAQSLAGKVVSGVARLARERGVGVAVLAGRVELSADRAAAAGFDVVVEVTPRAIPVSEAMERTETLVQRAAATLARTHLA